MNRFWSNRNEPPWDNWNNTKTIFIFRPTAHQMMVYYIVFHHSLLTFFYIGTHIKHCVQHLQEKCSTLKERGYSKRDMNMMTEKFLLSSIIILYYFYSTHRSKLHFISDWFNSIDWIGQYFWVDAIFVKSPGDSDRIIFRSLFRWEKFTVYLRRLETNLLRKWR